MGGNVEYEARADDGGVDGETDDCGSDDRIPAVVGANARLEYRSRQGVESYDMLCEGARTKEDSMEFIRFAEDEASGVLNGGGTIAGPVAGVVAVEFKLER